MTTALRHPQLDQKERAALESLGVPLDDSGLTIEITRGDEWFDATPAHDETNLPIQWTASIPILASEPLGRWSHYALEHGPDEATSVVMFNDSGALDDLHSWFDQLDTEWPNIHTDTGVTLNICGWALWAAGHLA